MTKSTITRERLQELFAGQSGFNLRTATHEESQELARIALAAIDSEPVAWKVRFKLEGQPGSNFNKFFENKKAMNDVVSLHELGGFNIDVTPLYLHAQQPVVPDDLSIFEAAIEECKKCDSIDEHAWNHGVLAVIAEYESCRAAMLQASNSPAQSDCCPAQNHVSPEQNGDTPAQSQGWIPLNEQMPPSRHEVLVGCWWGEKPRWCCKWATYIPGHPDAQSSGWLIPGASWTPTHWMPLPAAPQEEK